MNDTILEKDVALLKKTVHSFVKDKVLKEELYQKDYIQELPNEVVLSLKKAANPLGLQAMGAKMEWGGAGLSLHTRTVLLEEASQHRLGLYHPAADAFGEELPTFLERCTKDQLDQYVKPSVLEGKGCFVALWEEKEDNHLQNLSCTAVKSEDSWIINGTKSYIQKIEQSNFGVILVNCIDDEKDEKKPTLFILDLSDPFEKKESVLIDVQKTTQLTFKNFSIHDDRRIGDIGEGMDLVRQYLTEAQILLSARCLGIAVKALEYSKDYAKIRITRGKLLAEFPSIRTMIADGIIKLKAARLMVQDAALKVDKGEKDAEISAQMAKAFATDTAAKIIDDALQIHGGAGFAGDIPIERWYKEIRIARLDLLKKENIIENIASLNL